MPPFNFNKFKKNAQATIRAWQPGPPGLSLPQPPPMVIEENANAGNNLLAAINLERQNGVPVAPGLNPNAQAFVPAPAAALALNPNAAPFVPGLNPNAAPFVPAAALNPNAQPFVPGANPNAGGKRRRYRKSRKTRKARKTRKTRKSRRTYK